MNRTGKFCHKNKQKRSGFYKFMKKKNKIRSMPLFFIGRASLFDCCLDIGNQRMSTGQK